MLECVVNISEGRRADAIASIAAAAGPHVLDVHSDHDHHRTVLTLAGSQEHLQQAVRAVARSAVAQLDLRSHHGAHPRIGVLDVVPFVDLNLASGVGSVALAARDRFAKWAGTELRLPCFRYGPERSLPDLRRQAWRELLPDEGPGYPHPTAGAVAVGVRPVLVAYNLWLAEGDLARAKRIATLVRGDAVRALGLDVGGSPQVSCNLIVPERVGPAEIWDAVAARAPIARAELVGLIPRAVLATVPPSRWAELDLTEAKTIESRLAEAGLDGGG